MDILKEIKSTRKYEYLYKIPFKTLNTNFDVRKDTKNIRVCLLVNACWGFGDLIFALKIYNYIKEWYNIDSVILTSQPKYFLDNGIKLRNVYGIKLPGQKSDECIDTKYMKIYKVDKSGKFLKKTQIDYEFDFMALCPFIANDFKIDSKIGYNTIKNFFPYANRFNSFLFSSYNLPNPKAFDFPTGVGKGYLGLLLTDPNLKTKKNKVLPFPYIMVHVSYYESVDATKCFVNFAKLMCKKYSSKHRILDIVTPEVVLDDPDQLDSFREYIIKKGYYDDMEIIQKNSTKKNKYNKSDRILRLRFDILPLPYNSYISLFNHCLPDVLLTGNQSVTDVISCCKYYNIYYQIMPWEYSFATNINNILKPKDNYLRRASTACGYEKMDTTTRGNLIKIKKAYDFRKLGKSKLDKIFTNINSLKTNPDLVNFVDIVNNSRKKSTVLSKFKVYLQS